MASWQCGELAVWRVGSVASWQCGEMVMWGVSSAVSSTVQIFNL